MICKGTQTKNGHQNTNGMKVGARSSWEQGEVSEI